MPRLAPLATFGPCEPRPSLAASADASGPLGGCLDRTSLAMRWYRTGAREPVAALPAGGRVLHPAKRAPRVLEALAPAVLGLDGAPTDARLGPSRGLAISPDGRHVLACGDDAWCVWAAGREVARGPVERAALTGRIVDGGRTFALGNASCVTFHAGGTTTRWEGALVYTPFFAASPDGRLLACRDRACVHVWSFVDGRYLARIAVRRPEAVALLDDLVLVAQWTRVRAFRPTGEPLGELPIRAAAVAILGAGELLWTGGANADLAMWDVPACRAALSLG